MRESSNNYNESLTRLLQLMRHIPNYSQPKTAQELHDLLESKSESKSVTLRTTERNLESLSRIFPITTHDETRPKGWSWAKDAKTFMFPHLSSSQALVLSLAKKHLSLLLPIKQMKEIENIFRYASNVLEEDNVKLSKEWQKKVAIIPANQPLLPPKYRDGVIEAVYDALFHEKQMEVSYDSFRTQEKTLLLNPLGLYQRASNLYLVASILKERKPRNWALHRILKAKVLEEKIKKPQGFSLEKFIESGQTQFYGSGKTIQLELKLQAWLARLLEETPLSKDQKLILEEDGSYRLKAIVPEYEQLRWWLQSLGSSVVVLKPLTLRKEIMGILKETLAQYEA